MIQTKYALSYNVEAKAIDILKRIREYDTEAQLHQFVDWFNDVIEAKGRVMMIEICQKMRFEAIEAFSRIGFNAPITENYIYQLFRVNGTLFYQILFPVLRDFTLKEKE